MIDVGTQELKKAVESQHGCMATLAQSVPVKETFGDKSVWEGIVHIFKIYGHPQASQAFARSSPIEGSDKRRFFAVLHVPPIASPVDAVRRLSWQSNVQNEYLEGAISLVDSICVSFYDLGRHNVFW